MYTMMAETADWFFATFIHVTRRAQRAQTSAERQNPVNPDFGLLDLDGDPDRHQNVISWSLSRSHSSSP